MSSMPAEGALSIELSRRGPSRVGATIRSTRPVHAARMLRNKSPDEVRSLLPLLFSVCGTAQACAGARALDHALQLEVSSALDDARTRLVHMETAREHLLRILLDWRRFLACPKPSGVAPAVMALTRSLHGSLFQHDGAFERSAQPQVDNAALDQCVRELVELLDEQVFGRTPQAFVAISSFDALVDWAHSAQTTAACLVRQVLDHSWARDGRGEAHYLPPMETRALNQRLAGARGSQFIEQPEWDARACETTPLGRQIRQPLVDRVAGECGTGLLTRLVAQLVELATIPHLVGGGRHRLDDMAPLGPPSPLASGVGIGQVEAARGRLVHRVTLLDGCVQDYQILAPTEWNFHPRGVAANALGALPDDDHLHERAELLIVAIDPCVGYSLAVH